MRSCCPAKPAGRAIPTLLVKNSFAGIPRASAAIRVRVSSVRSVAGVIAIAAVTAAVVAVRTGVPIVAEVLIVAETVAVGVSNAAGPAVRIAAIMVDMDMRRNAVRNSFPKCSRLART
jgi:hypothetical protein